MSMGEAVRVTLEGGVKEGVELVSLGVALRGGEVGKVEVAGVELASLEAIVPEGGGLPHPHKRAPQSRMIEGSKIVFADRCIFIMN